LSLLDGTPCAQEWDADMEWIPDVEDDPELEIYCERSAP
jgi:hypothetical protein